MQPAACPHALDPTRADPAAEYARLREAGPAALVDMAGLPAWAITDPNLARQLLMSDDVTKDVRNVWSKERAQEVLTTWPYAMWIASESMFTASGDEHRRLREVVAPAFAGSRITALRPQIEQLVDELVDQLAKGPNRVDLRQQFCAQLPVTVICQLMGIPEDYRQQFASAAEALGREPNEANAVRMYGLLQQLVDLKKDSADEDLTTHLIQAELAGQELLDMLLLVFSAGWQTTVDVLDWAFVNLLSHPEQLAVIQEGRATWRQAGEETIRQHPPVPYLPLRAARDDIQVPGGPLIKQGDAVLIAYEATGRDPETHGANPDDFDITRNQQRHLGFGHGPHACLGATLARLQIEAALQGFFTRFPRAQLAEPASLKPIPSLTSNGHLHVPVVLDPEV